MRWWRELAFILDRLIHRRRAERELDEDISVHREYRSFCAISVLVINRKDKKLHRIPVPAEALRQK
jgi:hypothetical protein